MISKVWLLSHIIGTRSQVHTTQCPRSIHTCWNSQWASMSRSWNFKHLNGKYHTCATTFKIAKSSWIILLLSFDFGTQDSLQKTETAERLNCFKELQIYNLCEACETIKLLNSFLQARACLAHKPIPELLYKVDFSRPVARNSPSHLGQIIRPVRYAGRFSLSSKNPISQNDWNCRK